MKCAYRHHAEFGTEIACPTCGGELVCGPFMHSCRVCEPAKFRPCAICGTAVVGCSC